MPRRVNLRAAHAFLVISTSRGVTANSLTSLHPEQAKHIETALEAIELALSYEPDPEPGINQDEHPFQSLGYRFRTIGELP